MLRWSKWVKVGLNPGKVVLRWSKWVKVGLNPGTVVLRWSKWVKVGVNPGKVVLRECKRVKGGLNPDTGVLRWSKRVKGSLIWFKCGSKLIHTDPEYPCKTKYLPDWFPATTDQKCDAIRSTKSFAPLAFHITFNAVGKCILPHLSK